MRIQFRLLILSAVILALAPVPALPGGLARQIVVVVWDGMRPDFVTEKNTPVLWNLSQRGVTFRNHHPVYVSSTEVNATAISTGAFPGHSTLIANIEYRPKINPVKPIGTEAVTTIRKGDKLYTNYLQRPTLAEIIQHHNGRTVIAGTKPVALLHDRAERPESAASITLFEGRTLPASFLPQITNRFGPFPPTPPTDTTKAAQDLWTTQAFLSPLWNYQTPPTFSLLWLAEPDFSQHTTSPGSPQSLAAIQSSDRNLGRVLDSIRARGWETNTDVFVVSDHAFSTVAQIIDVVQRLRDAGFDAVREFADPAQPGQIMVASNGGSVLLYVEDHTPKVVSDLIHYLQTADFTGVIFTQHPFPGTFTLDQARLQSPYAPDVLFSMRWNSSPNQYGAPGLVLCEGDRLKTTRGMHVTLSAFDMHNTLIAAGPDFKSGVLDPFPSSNMDLAPTILWILGIVPPIPMDGRVLTEALSIPGPPFDRAKLQRLESQVPTQKGLRTQYLLITELNGVSYFEEGNSFRSPNPFPFPRPPTLFPYASKRPSAGRIAHY